MKRTYLTVVVSIFLALSACIQRNQESSTDVVQDSTVGFMPTTHEEVQGISEVITRFVRAYASRDNGKANRLIHPDLGLYIIYRPGVADSFIRIDSLDFNAPIPDYYPFPSLQIEHASTFDQLPVFSCDDFTWDKAGFICDTSSHPLQLMQIALFENEFNEGTYSTTDIKYLEDKAKNSFRVIVTAEDPLIFHVQYYEGAWYVTVLDRAYAGCDA